MYVLEDYTLYNNGDGDDLASGNRLYFTSRCPSRKYQIVTTEGKKKPPKNQNPKKTF